MAVTASFDASTGVLSIISDNLDNTVTVSRNAAGTILVNGGAVAVVGGLPTVANTTLIQAFGLGGNDNLLLDQSNGALPAANLFGGAGNDTATGGASNDMLFGQSENDVLLGGGGGDFLFGGAGDDTLTGGDGDDQVFGESGNDLMVWNAGDDTNLFEGGADFDTAQVNGGNGAEIFTVTANGARVRFDRLDPAPFSLDIGTTEQLVLNAGGGNDFFSATGNLAALIQLTVDGGAGNDTLLGSNGADILLGGTGNDVIDGQQGNDVAFLGAGNDTFQWDPGDGSDVVEGQAGTDTLLFNGSSANEIFEVSANGGRARFTRNIANIVMDLDDVETIQLNALGGADTLIVNDLSGTDVTKVSIDLAGVLGGTAGDGQADTVIVNGNNADNAITVSGSGTSLSVTGLPTTVSIKNSEGANDTLVINALGGNDKIAATALPAGVAKLVVDGGAGNDMLLGSQGADIFLGGDGNDSVFGDNGNDLALLGAGDDVFQWDPGDGNDTVEGQAGTDTLLFNGSNVAETVDIVANGGRALFFRNIASVTMDLDDVEIIDFNALGGADTIVVGDLSGTDVTRVDIDLAGTIGGTAGDKQADSITVNGTNGNDVIAVASTAGKIAVTGLQAQVVIDHAEAGDKLVINGLGSDDVIDASALQAGKIQLQVNAGLGADVVIGSAGDDTVNGGDGNDLALLGGGNDLFVWNPGDDNDIIEGQAGTDTLLFNGANVAETIDISANGGRATLFRNVASVTMDLDDVETIAFNALGGADIINVNDLAGTDVKLVGIDLAAAGGTAGDGQVDTVFVNGGNGNNGISVGLVGNKIVVGGLAAQVAIDHAEAGDQLAINALAGNDTINAGGLAAGKMALLLFAGDGEDTVTGSAGKDQLFGQGGNDVLVGGGGGDVLFGGAGNDTLTGGAGDDQVFGEGGNDLMVWNPGDDTDLFEGGADIDTAQVNGAGGGEVFTITANGARVRFDRLDPAPFSLDIGTTENLVVNLNGGNDKISATGNLAALISITIDGGAGNDTILGSNGQDTLLGSTGNDFIDGQQGNDVAFLGAGNDAFQWDPGDGSDVVEGQAGTDTLLFNGSAANEIFEVSANGERVLFTRNVGNIVMDLNDVETIKLNALGGTDTVIVNGLAGTDAKLVAVDLAGTIGGTTGDGLADTVIVNGSNANDSINLALTGTIVSVTGLPVQVTIDHADAADTLVVNGLGGNDTINASKLPAGALNLVIDGGAGNDRITGGAGDDVLIGGAGNDTISTASGNDVVRYTSVLDGRDIINGFDGNAAGGQDLLDLDALFDGLGVVAADRAGRVSVVDKGASVDVSVDADGNAANGFELIVATLNTADVITVGQDVIVGA